MLLAGIHGGKFVNIANFVFAQGRDTFVFVPWARHTALERILWDRYGPGR